MVQIKIPLKLKVKVETKGFEFENSKNDEAIKYYLTNKRVFFPVKLSTKLNTYAGKLEFGTNPGEELFTKEDRVALDKWFQEKVGITDPDERRARVNAMVERYKSVGHFPRPWFRPAIWSVFDNLESEFDNGAHSFYDLAVEMRDRAQENLDTLGINYTGQLSRSLTVEYLTQDEYRRVMSGKIDNKVLDEYWNRYRRMEEVIPDDDGRTKDSKRAEWQA